MVKFNFEYSKDIKVNGTHYHPSLKKTAWLICPQMKLYGKKEKFWFVRQIWLAPNLVYSIVPPFFDIKVVKKLLITRIEWM